MPRKTKQQIAADLAAARQRSALERFARGEWAVRCPNGRAHDRSDGGPRILTMYAASHRWYSER